jgi:hypothetical protein
MAKKKPKLAAGELELLAWRIGAKLGSALDRNRHAVWHLKQATASATAGSKSDVHVPTALANEIGMMQDFDACSSLVNSIGLKLAPLDDADECRKLFYRGNKLKPAEVQWIPGFVASVEKRLESAYHEFLGHFRGKDKIVGAQFDFAVRASMCITSPDDPAKMSDLASEAKLPAELVEPFTAAVGARLEADAVRKEFYRLDKAIERHLLDGLSSDDANIE